MNGKAENQEVTVVVFVHKENKVFVLNSIKTTKKKEWLAVSLFCAIFPLPCDITTKTELLEKQTGIECRGEELAIDKQIDEETGIARWEQTAMALHIAEKYYADDVLTSVDCLQETT